MTGPIRKLLKDRSFKALIVVLVITLVIGMVFFSRAEHWSLLNAMYFSVMTLSTVGYGDLTPHTDSGKIFAMIYTLFGIGVILAFVGVVTKNVTKHYTKLAESYIKRSEDYLDDILSKNVGKNQK